MPPPPDKKIKAFPLVKCMRRLCVERAIDYFETQKSSPKKVIQLSIF